MRNNETELYIILVFHYCVCFYHILPFFQYFHHCFFRRENKNTQKVSIRFLILCLKWKNM